MAPLPSASASWLPGLLRFWTLFALATFGILLMHQSDDAVLFGRYSMLVSAVLVMLLLMSAAMWGGAGYLKRHLQQLNRIAGQLERWRRHPAFAPLVIMIAGVVLALMWLFFLGNHLPTYGFLRLFLGASIIMVALALVYGGAVPGTINWKWLPYLLAGSLIVVILISVSYYPPLAKTDEAFVFSMARNALETGQTRPQIYVQAYPPYYYGGVWVWMMAAWLKIASLSLTAGRLYVLVIGGLSLVFLYAGLSRLYDRLTAGFAVLFGIYAFASLNHIRFDVHTAFWLSMSIFFYGLTRREGRWWAHIGTGFAVGMCIDSNPIGYCFGAGLFLAYAWEYVQRLRRREGKFYVPVIWLALGGFIALIVYFRLHSGAAFAKDQTTGDMLGYYVTTMRNNLLAGGFRVQLHQYLYAFLTNQPIVFGFMLLGIIGALRERKPADVTFLIMMAVWTGVVIFAYFYFPYFYLMLALPLFLVFAARGAAYGIPWLLGTVTTDAAGLARATSILVTVWLFAALIYGIMKLPSQSLEDVVEAGRHIGEIVPADSTILAAEAYYFGMLDHQKFVGGAMESAMNSYFGTPPEQVWQDIQPDAVVFSEGWPTEPERTPALMSYMQAENFGLQACYQTASFGKIELWARGIPQDTNPTCTTVCNPRTGC